MTIYDLMIVFLLVLVGVLIWQNAGFRDRVLGLARQQCDHKDVQLLDETVGLVSMTLGKDGRGNFGVKRTYEFDFTATGERRYKGQLVMLGSRLIGVELEAHQFTH